MKEIRLSSLVVLILCITAILFYIVYPKYYFPQKLLGHMRCNRITGRVERFNSSLGEFESIEKSVRTVTEYEISSAKSEDLSFLPDKPKDLFAKSEPKDLSFWERASKKFDLEPIQNLLVLLCLPDPFTKSNAPKYEDTTPVPNYSTDSFVPDKQQHKKKDIFDDVISDTSDWIETTPKPKVK